MKFKVGDWVIHNDKRYRSIPNYGKIIGKSHKGYHLQFVNHPNGLFFCNYEIIGRYRNPESIKLLKEYLEIE